MGKNIFIERKANTAVKEKQNVTKVIITKILEE